MFKYLWVNSVCFVHSDKVQAICYIQLTRQLVSCSADGGIAVWNMDISREEVSSRPRSKIFFFPFSETNVTFLSQFYRLLSSCCLTLKLNDITETCSVLVAVRAALL